MDLVPGKSVSKTLNTGWRFRGPGPQPLDGKDTDGHAERQRMGSSHRTPPTAGGPRLGKGDTARGRGPGRVSQFTRKEL